MEKYLTISEVADILKVSKSTLRRWDESGKFSAKRLPMNNYRYYPRTQVEEYSNLFRENTDKATRINFDTLKSPYFRTRNGKIYNEDAIRFLQSLPRKSVDLIFADPPYNIKKAEWDTFDSQKQYIEWSLKWITEASRVLKETGTLYICGFSEILADLKWAANPLFRGCKWIVWFYRNKANLGKDWGRSHESLLHFRKSKNYTFNIDEVRIPYNEHTLKYPKRTQAETSQYNNGNKKKHVWLPNPKGAKPKDVLEIPTLSNGSWEKTNHTTQKPIELVRKCILASSNEGDLIVDPFGGSGTTYVVAEAFNRKWLGTELNQGYCNIIAKRLSNSEHIDRIRDSAEELEVIARRKALRNSK